jgi:hypothetical protein
LDDADNTKIMAFQLSGITGGQTSVLTIPDADFTVCGLSLTQTFTGTNTFGTAAGAANSWKNVSNGIEFEGATAGDFELTLTVTDPFADTTFTLGPSPDGNPWIGATAGDSASATETDNVLLGSAAGTAMSGTSTDNTLVGDNAGSAITSGDANVCIGADSCSAVTTNYSNVNIGVGATSSEGARENVIIGYGATSAGGATRDNVIIGTSAVGAGSNGVAVGDIAGVGTYGVAVGPESDAKGQGSVSIGYRAGASTAAADVDNVFIGDQAGIASNGTSTDNTYVGDLSGDAATTGDRNTLYGANTDLGTVTDSDVTAVGESMVGKESDSLLIGHGGQEDIFKTSGRVTLTESTATALFRVSVVQGAVSGGEVTWTVNADDASDYQSLSNACTFNVVNVGGTETCTSDCRFTAGNGTEAASGGTLAMEANPTCVTAAADTVDFQLDMVSSLTQTTLEAQYMVILNGPGTITPQ